MNAPMLKLASPPIVEAVVDIDCDMPPGLEIKALESAARDAFQAQYPKFRTQLIQEHQFKQEVGAPPEVSVRSGVQALRFFQEDEKQLVQVRTQGFSFNRLAPYSSLDDYLSEIQRTWRLFLRVAAPVRIRLIRLRYINRILLPLKAGRVNLDHYLKRGPRLPDEKKLSFVGFLQQYSAAQMGTKNQVNIVLAAEAVENDKLPIIFDIEAVASDSIEPEEWSKLHSGIQSLRNLKNMVFENSLTKRCLKLFQHGMS